MVEDHFQGWTAECASCRWVDPNTNLLSLCTLASCADAKCAQCGSSRIRIIPVFQEKK